MSKKEAKEGKQGREEPITGAKTSDTDNNVEISKESKGGIFFSSVVYFSVGLSSLFFTVWLLTYFSFFQSSAGAKEIVSSPTLVAPTTPALKNPNVKAPKAVQQAPQVVQAPKTAPAPATKNSPVAPKTAPAPALSTSDSLPSPDQSAKNKKLSSKPNNKLDNSKPNKKPSEKPDKKQNTESNKNSDVDELNKKPNTSSNNSTSNPVSNTVSNPVSNPNSVSRGLSSSDDSSPPPPPPSLPSESSDESFNGVKLEVETSPSHQPNNPVDSNPAISDLKSQDSTNLHSTRAQELHDQIINIHNRISSPYSTDTRGRNPFKPTHIKQALKSTVVLSPSEKYPLKDMILIGIKWGPGVVTPKALFRAGGKLFTLQKNDRIGNKRGIIYMIREDEVVVVQPETGDIHTPDTKYTPIIISLNRTRSNRI